MMKLSAAFNLAPSVLFFSEEESKNRIMFAALIATCKKYINEEQLFGTINLIRIQSYPDSSDRCASAKDSQQSHEEPASLQAQP